MYLIQTASIAIEEHAHAVLEDLARLILGKRVFAALDGVTEQWDRDVCPIACANR